MLHETDLTDNFLGCYLNLIMIDDSLNRTLTFHSMRLMALGSGRLLGMMLHGVVVFVPARDDGCICTIYVICLANT